MGYAGYSTESRLLRSSTMGYSTKSIDEVFIQQKERKVHESMSPKGIKLRECRDSATHPNTVPIILALDVTGSMGGIPHELIKGGLPKLMGNLIQKGCPDASLLFLAVGDHECDRFPMQVAQFESGDEELDMWLTRTYIERGGGGNAGESYLLAWEFAANRTETDAFEKRGKKGILITVGDEPNLKFLPKKALEEIYGAGNVEAQSTQTKEYLLAKAQEKWDVYHINLSTGQSEWTQDLGKNHIQITRSAEAVPDAIVEIVLNSMGDEKDYSGVQVEPVAISPEKEKAEILL